MIDAIDDVITIRFTLCIWQASIAASVPLTAGFINSASVFGYFNGNGDAVCTTNYAPFTASIIDYLLSRSASTRVS